MFCCQDALVAELVDAHASGACGRSPVEVQVLFRAPIYKIKALQFLRGFFYQHLPYYILEDPEY